MQAGSDIMSTGTALLEKNTGVGLLKEIIAMPEQKVEASSLLNAMQVVGGQLVGEAQTMTEEESLALSERVNAVFSEAKDLAVAESELARKLMAKGSAALGSGEQEDDPLVSKGKALLEAGFRNPTEAYATLSEDAEFLSSVKAQCLQFLEATITGELYHF